MEIFPKDSLSAPKGWEKRRKGGGDEDRKFRGNKDSRQDEKTLGKEVIY